MSSNNLRNNELDFTPTFGTQHIDWGLPQHLVQNTFKALIEEIMKAYLLLVILVAVSSLAIADTTYYYVNIDNAPDGTASGTMKAYFFGEPYEYQTTTLTFIENYYGGMGGKYRSTDQLDKSTPSFWITIKCAARKPWGPDWLWGYSEQTFTGGSGVYLPTIHIEDPPMPPNPPDPK